MARLAVARSAIHVRSKGPRPKGGVDPEAALAVVGSRAVGCADHARASGRDAPPLCPFAFRGRFFYVVSKTRSLPRRSWHSDGPLVAFSVGHRWATWPTYPWNRCRSKGGVAHGERPLCHAWPTHPDGAFGAVRAVHEASPHSIMGALVAPPGRQVRHGPARVRRSRGPGHLWYTPPEVRSRV